MITITSPASPKSLNNGLCTFQSPGVFLWSAKEILMEARNRQQMIALIAAGENGCSILSPKKRQLQTDRSAS